MADYIHTHPYVADFLAPLPTAAASLSLPAEFARLSHDLGVRSLDLQLSVESIVCAVQRGGCQSRDRVDVNTRAEADSLFTLLNRRQHERGGSPGILGDRAAGT